MVKYVVRKQDGGPWLVLETRNKNATQVMGEFLNRREARTRARRLNDARIKGSQAITQVTA